MIKLNYFALVDPSLILNAQNILVHLQVRCFGASNRIYDVVSAMN